MTRERMAGAAAPEPRQRQRWRPCDRRGCGGRPARPEEPGDLGQGAAERALPVRLRQQVQALPRPAGLTAPHLKRSCLSARRRLQPSPGYRLRRAARRGHRNDRVVPPELALDERADRIEPRRDGRRRRRCRRDRRGGRRLGRGRDQRGRRSCGNGRRCGRRRGRERDPAAAAEAEPARPASWLRAPSAWPPPAWASARRRGAPRPSRRILASSSACFLASAVRSGSGTM